MFFPLILLIYFAVLRTAITNETGYIVYCPCMGRFGNQADHFLGSLGFAKGINRTLVLPPWVEYRYGESKSRQVPFNTYFQVDPLLKFHDVMLMEDFMKEVAPNIWPPKDRIAFCYMSRGNSDSCNAKEGNPFGPFWDTYNIDFVASEYYGPLNYDVHNSFMVEKWKERYPVKQWPVLAFTGAPASFPIQKENVGLHRYLKWSNAIDDKAKSFIKNLPRAAFIGIHLRNGVDWVRACEHVPQTTVLFSSPQCFGYRSEYGPVTKDACLPPRDSIIKQLKRIVRSVKNVASIFVAADNYHMIPELEENLGKLGIRILKYPENNPHVDLAILGRADHFIGNCVSSFSAFVKRERDVRGFPSSFWAFPPPKKEVFVHDEL